MNIIRLKEKKCNITQDIEYRYACGFMLSLRRRISNYGKKKVKRKYETGDIVTRDYKGAIREVISKSQTGL